MRAMPLLAFEPFVHVNYELANIGFSATIEVRATRKQQQQTSNFDLFMCPTVEWAMGDFRVENKLDTSIFSIEAPSRPVRWQACGHAAFDTPFMWFMHLQCNRIALGDHCTRHVCPHSTFEMIMSKFWSKVAKPATDGEYKSYYQSVVIDLSNRNCGGNGRWRR